MKNVLVLLHEDDGQEARLQAALDLTRAISGHLLCQDFVTPPKFMIDYASPSGGVIERDHVQDREAANRRAIEARLKEEDVPWSMLDPVDAPGRKLIDACALADVIVASSPGVRSDRETKILVGEVAVKSGRPVLAVPATAHGLNVAGNVLIGWNGSREAGDALRDAVPLLQLAASVTLLELNNPWVDHSSEEAARYLSRHGVHAEVVESTARGSISEAILDKAREIDASYIVIGAFGLPRRLEAMFGGVTDAMLRQSDLPVLLMH